MARCQLHHSSARVLGMASVYSREREGSGKRWLSKDEGIVQLWLPCFG